MNLNYRKSQSSVYPELIDTTSSKKYVYLRENVVEKQSDDMDGKTYIYYEYDEAKITKEEYEQYLNETDASEFLETIENLKNRIIELETIALTTDAMTNAILEGVNEV